MKLWKSGLYHTVDVNLQNPKKCYLFPSKYFDSNTFSGPSPQRGGIGGTVYSSPARKKRENYFILWRKKRIQDTISCLNLLPAQLSVAHLKSTNITGSPDLFPRHPDLDQELDSVQDSPKTQFPPRSTLVLVCRWTCERSALSSLASSPSPSSTPSSSTMTWSPASAAFTGSSTAPGVHATCKWETQQSMRWASVGGAVRMSQPTQSSWPNGPTNAWGQKAGR